VRSGCLTFYWTITGMKCTVYAEIETNVEDITIETSRLSIKSPHVQLGIQFNTWLIVIVKYCNTSIWQKKEISVFSSYWWSGSTSLQYCRTPLHLLKRRIDYGTKSIPLLQFIKETLKPHYQKWFSCAIFRCRSQPWKLPIKWWTFE
jgi:hypothetical protein